MNTWLWPDHEISKSESRRLREEHNALANSHADLMRALRDTVYALEQIDRAIPGASFSNCYEARQARAAIVRAGG